MRLPIGVLSRLPCFLALLVGASLAQAASFSLSPFISAEVRQESNLFLLSPEDAEAISVTQKDDTVTQYAVGADVRYEAEQRLLQGRFEGQQSQYRRFDQLDHSGHRINLSAESALPGPFGGEIGFLDERRLASFEDRRSTERSLERERGVRGELRFALNPRYALYAGSRQRTLRTPITAAPGQLLPLPGRPARPASPDFRAREAAYVLGIAYGESDPGDDTVPPLSMRLGLEQQRVRFNGLNRPAGEPVPDDDGYELLILGTQLIYTVSGLSAFNAEVGATQYRNRDGDGEDPTDLTGDISYRRSLSALTQVEVGLFRRIELFSATADTTTDTGYHLEVRWEPRLDVVLTARHQRTRSEFDGLSGVAADNRGRKDRTEVTELSIVYPLWRSSNIQLFGRLGDRESRGGGNDYRDDQLGVKLTLQTP